LATINKDIEMEDLKINNSKIQTILLISLILWIMCKIFLIKF